MQLIAAALAFAITMLVLSLTVSSFVEIVHRVFSMREAGLQYMLGQMFDQVLKKYLKPDDVSKLVPAGTEAAELLEEARKGFVARMSANRAPMGATPKATPSDSLDKVASKATPADSPVNVAPQQKLKQRAIALWSRITLWSGRDLSSMTAAEFMERLGSIDVGEYIKRANDQANANGAAAAGTADAILKDIAQKFEAFGNEAASYFEGRARLLSVCVAVVLAFAIRVDAIELFNTYLSDPNARNAVIEQTQAVTAQYKAAAEAAAALKSVSGADPSTAADVKKQVESLQKDLQSSVDSTRNTVKQYADLGLPIGWTKQNATLDPRAKACSKNGVIRLPAADEDCRSDEKPGEVGWWPVVKLIASLLLGGLLVGLGGPFWYDVVTGLTNIRSIAKDIAGSDQTKAAPRAPAQPADPVQAQAVPAQPPASKTPDRPQPATPVGAFNISQAAVAAAPAARVKQGG